MFAGLENWLANHTNTVDVFIKTIGIPVLLGIATLIYRSRAKTKDENTRITEVEQQLSIQKFERKQQKELKIAEFRQVWIISLRDAIAYYGQITSNHENWKLHQESIVGHVYKIQMMMNPNDQDYEALVAALKYRANASPHRMESKSHDPIHDNLIEVGQRILKREWNRLKSDLEDIEDLKNTDASMQS